MVLEDLGDLLGRPNFARRTRMFVECETIGHVGTRRKGSRSWDACWG